MADPEREDSYYHPGGVPVTPQARRFGYGFPVYVSTFVWRIACISEGIPSRHGENLEKRIWHLLQYCFDGMNKKLATEDSFLYYQFKIWYWMRTSPKAKKQKKAHLGARLFLDPSTGGPWLYIFAPNVDSIEDLTQGTDETSDSASSDSLEQEQFADFQENVSPHELSESDDPPQEESQEVLGA